jgi:hypothetical protein
MKEGRRENLPIDVRLLSDTVIELNISRRNVCLYPPGHSMVKESIERAFNLLGKLFELRDEITLGVVKDQLVIDEWTLDRKNPVFKDFALSLHSKDVAAVTFSKGLTREEITGFHELLTMRDSPAGGGLVRLAEDKGITHITLSPMDYSRLGFVEGALAEEGDGNRVLEDYVFALLEGRLAEDDARGMLLDAPPEAVADLLNNSLSEEAGGETYDRVITAYLKQKGHEGLSKKSFEKFLSFVNNLNPALKRQFLTRTFSHQSVEASDIEGLLDELTSEGFQKIAEFFTRHSSMIPEALKNVMDKLASVKKDKAYGFDKFIDQEAVIDDIEIDEHFMRLFAEDHFKNFVSDEYQRDLAAIMTHAPGEEKRFEELRRQCGVQTIDSAASGIILEMLLSGEATSEFRGNLTARLGEFVEEFVETGRFREVLTIHDSLVQDAGGAKEAKLLFQGEKFTAGIVESFKLWGRKNREEAMELARTLKGSLVRPLFDALLSEGNASTRKFLLSMLSELGGEVVEEAVRRLEDGQWFVQRNMLYLIRLCNGAEHAPLVRKFADHENLKVGMEAVKALLHFGDPDAGPLLSRYLESDDAELKGWAVSLAGTYRVKEALPHLMRLLDKTDILGTGASDKVSVIRALGKIGDEKAIGPLSRIYNAKTFLYRDYFEELKLEIFRNLGGYPKEALRPLLEMGLKSRNGEIRATSRKLLGAEP